MVNIVNLEKATNETLSLVRCQSVLFSPVAVVTRYPFLAETELVCTVDMALLVSSQWAICSVHAVPALIPCLCLSDTETESLVGI